MERSVDQRLTRLEEALAFQEHTLEQLDAQVRHFAGEIERLHKELARLEGRLADAAARGEDDPDPPG